VAVGSWSLTAPVGADAVSAPVRASGGRLAGGEASDDGWEEAGGTDDAPAGATDDALDEEVGGAGDAEPGKDEDVEPAADAGRAPDSGMEEGSRDASDGGGETAPSALASPRARRANVTAAAPARLSQDVDSKTRAIPAGSVSDCFTVKLRR
jgi:hypothetical protein